MSTLRDDLDALRLRPPAGPAPPGVSQPPDTLEQTLGGAAESHAAHACWVIRTRLDRVPGPLPVERRLLVVDIETGGFSGSPVFLIGALAHGPEQTTIVQYLARDYPEEAGILHAFADASNACDAWVTFNGRSFDEPFLRDRATLHRVPLTAPRRHVDLLHVARRRWRGVTPDCRLTTLERHILGRTRHDDIPGSDVPDLFHHFVRTGNARPLRGVLEHNRLDLVASLDLLEQLWPEIADFQ